MLLDKAIYGCVKAVALWDANLTATMEGDGFVANLFDACVFNKHESGGEQVVMAIYVDDLFVMSKSKDNHIKCEACMRVKYKEIKTIKGKMVDYIA